LQISLDILLSEIVMLARALGGFAHKRIKSRYLGFLMTPMLRLQARRASGVALCAFTSSFRQRRFR
jgi:hypothetical protein